MKPAAFTGLHDRTAFCQKLFCVGNPFGGDISVNSGPRSIFKNLTKMGTAQEKVLRQIFNRQFLGQISVYVR